MLNNLFSTIQNTAAGISFPPALEADITRARQQLSKLGFASLPEEYASFLRLTDGFYYDGLELLGSLPHLRLKKQYTFASLAEVNRDFSEYGYFSGKIIIGRMSENFIIYDGNNNLYAIIDRVNLCSWSEFSSFTELLSSALELCDITS